MEQPSSSIRSLATHVDNKGMAIVVSEMVSKESVLNAMQFLLEVLKNL